MGDNFPHIYRTWQHGWKFSSDSILAINDGFNSISCLWPGFCCTPWMESSISYKPHLRTVEGAGRYRTPENPSVVPSPSWMESVDDKPHWLAASDGRDWTESAASLTPVTESCLSVCLSRFGNHPIAIIDSLAGLFDSCHKLASPGIDLVSASDYLGSAKRPFSLLQGLGLN